MAVKILVADDEPFIARSLSYVLERAGYDVHIARDGEEALSKAREIEPELIILDLMMPKKTGYEVVQELRSDGRLKDVRIVLLTAKGQKSDRDRVLEAGADRCLSKPFSPSQILSEVREMLAEVQ